MGARVDTSAPVDRVFFRKTSCANVGGDRPQIPVELCLLLDELFHQILLTKGGVMNNCFAQLSCGITSPSVICEILFC